MQKGRRAAVAASVALVFALAGGRIVSAQNSPAGSRQTTTEPKPAGATSPASNVLVDAQDSQDGPSVPLGAADPYARTIREVGTGLPLFGTSSTPLRWGDFSISRIEYLGLHNEFEPNGSSTTTITNVSLFQTALMFDHSFRNSRLVLQYLPELAIINGEVSKDASANSNFEVGTSIPITGRMTLTLQDSFLQNRASQLIPQNYLAANWPSGAISQNNFLNNSGDYLSNSTSASLQYAFSPRTSVIVTPTFTYARTALDGGSHTEGQIYGTTVSISRALSPFRRIGAAQSYEYVRQLSGATTDAHYAVSSVFYSQQVSRYWWITGTAGATHQNSSSQANPTNWAFSGAGSIAGSISNSVGLALAYTRALTFNNYISTQQSDRLDGMIDLHLIRRLSWSNGAGYYRELGSSPRTSAKYAGASLSYNLFGDIHLFGGFTHTFQNANTLQLLSGSQSTVVFGVRWEPPRTRR